MKTTEEWLAYYESLSAKELREIAGRSMCLPTSGSKAQLLERIRKRYAEMSYKQDRAYWLLKARQARATLRSLAVVRKRSPRDPRILRAEVECRMRLNRARRELAKLRGWSYPEWLDAVGGSRKEAP